MTSTEILTKAIQKATSSGWVPVVRLRWTGDFHIFETLGAVLFFTEEGKEVKWVREEIIFNHDFAKALWGNEHEELAAKYNMDHYQLWQHHLQQMVIAEDPIKYLGEHLNER